MNYGKRMRSGPTFLTLVLACLAPAVARADSLDAELLRLAPKIVEDLQARGVKVVGTLKFEVDRSRGTGGSLGLDLPDRLEMALILESPIESPPVVIRDASAVAASTPGADHRTSAGRKALFASLYAPAWGEGMVKADAFLTGKAVVGADQKTLSVIIEAIDRDGSEPRRLAAFEADADAPLLSTAGSSFLLRGAFDRGRIQKFVEPASKARKVEPETKANPLADPASPVALEVLYDGQPIPLEFHDGRAWLVEPRQGQKVEFALKKNGPSSEQYGVLLMVNGFNTIGKEKKPPIRCRKWIVGPKSPRVLIKGYQTDDAKAEAFQVLSSADSKKNESRYGPDGGTIQLVAFREAQGPGKPSEADGSSANLMAMLRGLPSGTKARNLSALRLQINGASPDRGLIEGGEAIGVNVKPVPFVTDPTPVMSATITYYRR